MIGKRAIFLAAGGTGGHLFPAQSLACVLRARGYEIELMTDHRALSYGNEFPARKTHIIASATPKGAGLVPKMIASAFIAWGVVYSSLVMLMRRPLCVIGFGGYPTVPPLLAASVLRVPSMLHEQNAVMGRANRYLANRVDCVATGFPDVGGLNVQTRSKARYIGNPVRPAALAAAKVPFNSFDARFQLLVTGGSQGARVMSDIVPAAIEMLSEEERSHLHIVQQARGEDEARVKAAYEALGLSFEVAPFFADLPQRIANAHLVIARSGASTVTELAVIGRPSILVPFPFALDQDQAANAQLLEKSSAARVVSQANFTPDWLANELRYAMSHRDDLAARANAAKSVGREDAAERLADLVIELIERHTLSETRA